MDKHSKIFIAGRYGMVGSAIERSLVEQGYDNIIGTSSANVNLLSQKETKQYFDINRPEYVFLAAAKVGGIYANNTYPADFIYENLQIQNNVIRNAHTFGVKKLLFLGSACIYPKVVEQPIKESSLLSAPLEPTNEPYAIAKIAGIVMCQSYNRQHGTDFICAMPTNAYGPGDNYHSQNSHVLPALIRKFHQAKIDKSKHVVCWGTGTPTREFIYADDLGGACVQLMNKYSGNDIVNIGTGLEISIRDLAHMVRKAVGYPGEIVWDNTKPDGTPRRAIDISKLKALGWKPKVDLDKGLRLAYGSFLESYRPT